MSYLRGISQAQISNSLSSGTVRINWTFGNMISDAIEIRHPGDTVTPPVLLASISINKGTKTPDIARSRSRSAEFPLSRLSPRSVQNGILTDRMVDDSGELHYWETFSVSLPLLTVAAADGGSGHTSTPKPTIGKVDISEGLDIASRRPLQCNPCSEHRPLSRANRTSRFRSRVHPEQGDRKQIVPILDPRMPRGNPRVPLLRLGGDRYPDTSRIGISTLEPMGSGPSRNRLRPHDPANRRVRSILALPRAIRWLVRNARPWLFCLILPEG
jgi:hypothetical protein